MTSFGVGQSPSDQVDLAALRRIQRIAHVAAHLLREALHVRARGTEPCDRMGRLAVVHLYAYTNRVMVGQLRVWRDAFVVVPLLDHVSCGPVDEAIDDRIGDRGIAEVGMPEVMRELAGDHRGAGVIAVLEEFQEVLTSRRVDRRDREVVQDDPAFEDLHRGRRQPDVESVVRCRASRGGLPVDL